VEPPLPASSTTALQTSGHLVAVRVEPQPVPERSLAELPDSAFRKLSQLEAQYIGMMRAWLKEEGSNPKSPLLQLSPDEQVQLALEAMNIELARKLQPRLPDSFASVAQAYLFGWGPLDHLMRLEEVTEVMVNGSVSIFIERAGRLEPVGSGLDDETIYTIAERMTGRRPTLAEPMLDDRLKDGSRLNATHASVSLLGASLSIRRFPQVALAAGDLIQSGAVTPELLHFLEALVRGRMNIVISGGTNTGKTTLLNILLGAIPVSQRLVIIEQAPAEIRCSLPNRGHLLTRPRTADGAAEVSVAALVRNALRMRPDRIVVGECRGGEALAMLQAMNTGHAGSLTTLHANNPFDALSRLETMVLMAESGLPHDAIRAQIARAIQIIVQTRRDPNGRRYVSEVVQVIPSTDSSSGYASSTLFEARLEHNVMVCRRTRAALDQDLIAQMISYGVRLDEIQAVVASGLGH
jgi:pilus assembly protein CpaF